MTETANEPPAGQTWDPTLRQWTPGRAYGPPELILRVGFGTSGANVGPGTTAQLPATTSRDLAKAYTAGTSSAWASSGGLPVAGSGITFVRYADPRWEDDSNNTGGVRFPKGDGGIITVAMAGFYKVAADASQPSAADNAKIRVYCDIADETYGSPSGYVPLEHPPIGSSAGWAMQISKVIDDDWGDWIGILPVILAGSISATMQIRHSTVEVLWQPFA